MRRRTVIAITASVVLAGAAASTGLASAHVQSWKRQPAAQPDAGSDQVVFVQGNDLEENEILAFRRADDGTLTPSGSFPTGGRGGAQTDNPFDPLASQDSLVFDEASNLLIAVNAGSDTITTFRVEGDRLYDRRTVESGGEFPTSITVSENLVYVLNAGGETNVSGFQIIAGGLAPIRNSTRSLGITNDNPPLFTDSPPQVGFTPDGRQLVVTTKSANTIEVFAVGSNGRLSHKPVSTESNGAVPFGFTFDAAGNLLVTEAGESGVTSYAIDDHGRLEVITPSVLSGQQVLCWITEAGGFFYGSNTGSSTISLYTVDEHGEVTLGGEDGVIAIAGGEEAAAEVAAAAQAAEDGTAEEGARAPGAGPIDTASTADGKFLYVQNTLAGTIEGYLVGDDGDLTLVTTLDEGLPVFTDGAGMEGIVAI